LFGDAVDRAKSPTLESYADVPDFDSREQRWTVAKR
jgi:hypothetical protein